MRCLVQRVLRASVCVDGQVISGIGRGLLVLACAMQGDTDKEARQLAGKVARLRIFADEAGRMNRALVEIGGQAMVVSQFTLAAETRGNRPGFSRAAPPDEACRLYELFADELAACGIDTARGRFGADMQVELVNDGPVTIWLDNGRHTTA